MSHTAILILQNGTVFYGKSMGANGVIVGEIVFNTAMTGYQEILTDPSYSEQIILFTYPHIGNVGTNLLDEESKKIQVKGMIAKNISPIASNFRSEESLENYIKKNELIAISDIDTRKLTRIIRNNGSQYGCIQTNQHINLNNACYEINKYIKKKIDNLAFSKSTQKIYKLKSQNYQKNYINDYYLNKNITIKKYKKNIIVYDLGIKKNILNILDQKGCKVTVVPANTSYKKILLLKPSGVVISNGPGDPRDCIKTIISTKKLLEKNIPILGICLGHQILALSVGAKIIKMKFGHHGSNHPVKNILTKQVFITSQNHNFTIDPQSINNKISITHISLFDQSIQGISIKNSYSFSFQGHPEASPGTNDMKILFEKFLNNILDKEKKCLKDKI